MKPGAGRLPKALPAGLVVDTEREDLHRPVAGCHAQEEAATGELIDTRPN